MKPNSRISAGESMGGPGLAPFNSLLLFDSDSSCTRALVTLDFVFRKLGEAETSEPKLCDLGQLRSSTRLKAAADQAAQADMILVSLDDVSPESPVLRDWIQSWRPRRTKTEGALVAILPHDHGPSQESVIIDLLRETAESARMDFICHSSE